MSTNYERGADFERRVVADLGARGFWPFRAAGSRGKADVLAIRPGKILLVQCKRNVSRLGRDEWNDLYRLACWMAGGSGRSIVLPLIACMPGRSGIEYRVVEGPVAPQARRLWTPWDERHAA